MVRVFMMCNAIGCVLGNLRRAIPVWLVADGINMIVLDVSGGS
jgi:hypothetical protein